MVKREFLKIGGVVVYQSMKDNIVWVRPVHEFCDGRFVKEE